MKRNDFSLESKVLGEDFSKLIDDFGGKAAGLKLLEKLIDNWNNPFFDKENIKRPNLGHYNEYQEEISIPLYYSFPTSITDSIEKRLAKHKDLSKKKRDYLIQNELKNNDDLQEQIKKILQQRFIYTDSDKEKIHVRTSTTIEDWCDDTYAGIFSTRQVKKDASNILDAIIKNYQDFFHYKEQPHLEIPADTKAGMVLMDSVASNSRIFDAKKISTHLTVYSGYPELNNDTAIIEGMSFGFPFNFSGVYHQKVGEMMDHIQVGANDIQFALEKSEDKHDQLTYPFTVNGKRSFLHKQSLLYLKSFTDYVRDTLQKEVNFEVITTQQNTQTSNAFVQLRPVPTIENFTPLPELSEDYVQIATTPLVQGVFSKELYLTNGHKGQYGSTFSAGKEVAAICDRNKAYRGWNEKSDLKLLVYQGTGVAINHGYMEGRNKFNESYWNSIGITKIDWNINLHGMFQRVLYNNQPYVEIPVPLLFESDGRQGRVSIKKEYLSRLQEERKNYRIQLKEEAKNPKQHRWDLFPRVDEQTNSNNDIEIDLDLPF